MGADQANEVGRDDGPIGDEASALLPVGRDGVGAAGAHRVCDAPAVRELPDQGSGDRGGSGGDDDRVERSVLREPEGPVAHGDVHVPDPRTPQVSLGPRRQIAEPLDREDLCCERRQDRRLEPEPGSDLEDLLGAAKMQPGDHLCDERGLRRDLAVGDRDRAISIGLPGPVRWDEVLAPHPPEGFEHPLIADTVHSARVNENLGTLWNGLVGHHHEDATRHRVPVRARPHLGRCLLEGRRDMDERGGFPRVVVVTGASAGVGRATVRAFAARGASVGLLARGRQGLEAAAKEVEAAGVRALPLSVDVADADAVEAAAARMEEDLGPIDVWVNNAMTSVFSPVSDTPALEIRRVTDVTYLGAVHGTLSALRRMRSRDRGVIVQVGSALSFRGIPLQAAYSAAKHAVTGFTDSVRTELLHDGSAVRLTEVHLPALNTPQFGWVRSRLPRKAQPVPPIYQPEIAADAIVWATMHRRRHVHVAGPTVATIWASRFFPSLVDRYLGRTGFDAQQTDEPEDPGRPDNLERPVEGDRGAHGDFDARAKQRSLHLWLTTRRASVGAVALLGAGALIVRKLRAS
jgi:short-subunit dehydrogenase